MEASVGYTRKEDLINVNYIPFKCHEVQVRKVCQFMPEMRFIGESGGV